jgi:hypothetical protein
MSYEEFMNSQKKGKKGAAAKTEPPKGAPVAPKINMNNQDNDFDRLLDNDMSPIN